MAEREIVIGQLAQAENLSLAGMREAIDSVDREIAALLVQRFQFSKQIGALKSKRGLPVRHSQREQTVIANVQAASNDKRTRQALSNVYTQIINESCALQSSPVPSDTIAQPADERLEASGVFPRVLIIGLGLIGATLARRIRQVMPQTIVTGIDKPEIIAQALSERLIASSDTSISRRIRRANLILLCAPPKQNLLLLKQLAPLCLRGQVILDVTSTKQSICALAESLQFNADFIGGHPLFGSHGSGSQSAEAMNIVGERFALVPTTKCQALTVKRVHLFLRQLGLQVVFATAARHDQTLAETSHSIQLLATALGTMLGEGLSDSELHTLASLSGTALASLARIMESPAGLWLEIAQQNEGAIDASLERLIKSLETIRFQVRGKDETALRAGFQAAARVGRAIRQVNAAQAARTGNGRF